MKSAGDQGIGLLPRIMARAQSWKLPPGTVMSMPASSMRTSWRHRNGRPSASSQLRVSASKVQLVPVRTGPCRSTYGGSTGVGASPGRATKPTVALRLGSMAWSTSKDGIGTAAASEPGTLRYASTVTALPANVSLRRTSSAATRGWPGPSSSKLVARYRHVAPSCVSWKRATLSAEAVSAGSGPTPAPSPPERAHLHAGTPLSITVAAHGSHRFRRSAPCTTYIPPPISKAESTTGSILASKPTREGAGWLRSTQPRSAPTIQPSSCS